MTYLLACIILFLTSLCWTDPQDAFYFSLQWLLICTFFYAWGAVLLRKPGVVLMELLGVCVLCVSAYYNIHDIGAYQALAAECDHASDVRISEQISQRKHKVLHDSDDPNAWRRYLDMYR